jgi:PTH1 family peptidyl-tRNA hydrolase
MFFKKKEDIQPNKISLLVVGLGNPGKKYSKTRHNIGWMAASTLAARFNAEFQTHTVYHYTVLSYKGIEIAVALPTTFMNASGEAVRKLCARFHVKPEKLVVICDEYNFPVGKIHLKRGGSDGGHNGIASIINELESSDFYRLRCGIGKGFETGGMKDYVLSQFEDEEIASLKDSLEKAADAIEYFSLNDPSRAMSFINSGKLWYDKQKTSVDSNSEIDTIQ